MMMFPFSKTIIEDGQPEGMFRRKPERYRITGLPDHGKAEFIHGHDLKIFSTSRQTLDARRISKWYQPVKWGLFESTGDHAAGEYKLSRITISRNYPGNDQKANGNLELNRQSFVFFRLPPAVKTKLFRKDTWGHYRFILRHETTDEYVEYNFRIDPRSGFTWRGSHRLFEGTVGTNSANVMLMLAGFHLIELVFGAEAAQAATM